MGYTHYWYREKEIDQIIFNKITEDFKKLLPLFKVLDTPLAGWDGEGKPEINEDFIRFNGKNDCGHKKNKNIVIPWPSKSIISGVAPSSNQAIVGSWFAGVELNQRTCDGSCSYETFSLPRVFPTDRYFSKNEEGKYFACCKTAFRPYDLAVTVLLIIAKHYLKSEIKVSSDGEIQHWFDAAKICQNAFNYGLEDFSFS